MKRLFDFACSLLGLVLLAPAFAVVAWCIYRNDGGSVFFRQVRLGRGGREFRIFKFRTMTSSPADGAEITVAGDSRVSSIGAVLRHYKIDELPQLINVLCGQMSLVGPRPEVPRYLPYYTERDRAQVLSLRPGITDFASIRFRHESELLAKQQDPEAFYIARVLPTKLAYCRRYARKQSVCLDFKIIAMTLATIYGRAPAWARERISSGTGITRSIP